MFGGLKKWASQKLVGAAVGTILKNAAEGEYGEKWKSLYWSMRGMKTWTAIVLGFIDGVAQVAVSSGLCAYLNIGSECGVVVSSIGTASGWASAFFLFLGQVDGSLHIEPPKAPGA